KKQIALLVEIFDLRWLELHGAFPETAGLSLANLAQKANAIYVPRQITFRGNWACAWRERLRHLRENRRTAASGCSNGLRARSRLADWCLRSRREALSPCAAPAARTCAIHRPRRRWKLRVCRPRRSRLQCPSRKPAWPRSAVSASRRLWCG